MQIKHLPVMLSVFAALALFAPGSALADDHPVNCETDSAGNVALQDALDAAGAGDTVTLAPNTTCDASDTDVNGYELPSNAITLQGSGGSVIDGGDEVRILTGTNVGATTISNIIFQNGDAESGNGGAIALDGDSPATIQSSLFQDNFAGDFGGAVSVEHLGTQTNVRAQGDPRVTLAGNFFGGTGHSNDTGFGGRGGAAYVVSADDTDVVNNQFAENTSPDGSGGGLYAIGNGAINLNDNQFSGNFAAAKGGGATLRTCSTATVNRNTFSDNTLTRPLLFDQSTTEFSPGGGPMGGGLHIADDQRRCEIFNPVALHKRTADSDVDVVQHDNEFSGNEIENTYNSDLHGTGGGEGTQDLNVKSTNDRFVQNTIHTPDGEGGGFGAQNLEGNLFEGRNLIAAGNSNVTEPVQEVSTQQQEEPDGEGGGVYVGSLRLPSLMRLQDSTVVSNQAGTGSGVAGEVCDGLELHNGIVTGNTGADEEISGFSGDGECTFGGLRAASPGTREVLFTDTCLGGNPHPGSGNICANPLLADPANGNVHETGNSPTLDKGSNGLVPSDLPQDIDGNARVQGASVDMGADEGAAAAPPPPPSSGCLNGGGNVSGKTLGPARLGRSQTSQREIFKGAKLRTRKGLDKYCAIPKGWFRIGYPNTRLFKGYGRSIKKATSKRVVLILTSSPRFSLLGLKRGDKRAKVRQKLKKEFSFVVGANRWYVVRTSGQRVLLVKVQDGLVREIGLGDGRFAKTNKLLKAYLRAWEGGL